MSINISYKNVPPDVMRPLAESLEAMMTKRVELALAIMKTRRVSSSIVLDARRDYERAALVFEAAADVVGAYVAADTAENGGSNG